MAFKHNFLFLTQLLIDNSYFQSGLFVIPGIKFSTPSSLSVEDLCHFSESIYTITLHKLSLDDHVQTLILNLISSSPNKIFLQG